MKKNKKMWMGDFLKKGSDSLFFYSPTSEIIRSTLAPL